MRHSLGRELLAGALSFTLLSGCRDVTVPSTFHAPGNASAKMVATLPSSLRTYDATLAQINAEVPGFGGIFLNASDEPVLVLQSGTDMALAQSAVARVLGGMPGRANATIRRQTGEFDFGALYGWLSRYIAVGPFAGVTMFDVDERRNRIVIGVDNLARESAIRSAFEGLKVPSSAVVVLQLDAPRALSTLRDSLRPIVGGLQFESYKPSNIPLTCSAGFNAKLNGDNTNLYLITNSHCTFTPGVVDGDSLYQPYRLVYWRKSVGHEHADPAWTSTLPGCPNNRVCRYSDAAAFRYENSASATLGRIARTQYYTTCCNTTTLVRDTADFILNGEITTSPTLVSGMWANKVGRTTGWTVGRIDETCIGVPTSKPANGYLLCQHSAWNYYGEPDTLFVDSGDSGSPVFAAIDHQEYGNGLNWLMGLAWAALGSPTHGGRTFVFSPMTGVKSELGTGQIAVNQCTPNQWLNGCL